MSKGRWDIVAVVLVGVLSTSWLAFKLYQTEQQSLERDFDYFATNQARLIKWRIDSSLSVMNHLSTLYQGSDEVTEQEFAMVADGILARHREIKALEWLPRVKASERGAFEAAMQDRYPAFTFTDKVQGQPVAAGQRDRYYPVYFVRPFTGNESRFGMDMSRQPEVTAALDQAMNSANPSLTAMNLDSELGKVVMAVVPIYHSLPLTMTSREKLLKGYLLGVFQVEEMLHDLVLDGHRANLEYQIWDDSGDTSILLLGAEPHPSVIGERSKRFVYADLAGREWRLEALANPAFFSSKRSLTPYLVGVGGALAALASGVFMWQMRRRNREVEELVRSRTEELNRVNQQLTRQSLTDGLTQVANRRQFDTWLSQEWESARRTSKPITLFVIDVDLFKSYNDRYGHLAGDRVLKKIARMLASQLNRPRDLLARYGGEEFAAVLPETGRKAVKFADSLRAMVEALGIPHEGSDIGSYVTISIGVATLVPEVDQTPEHFFELADKALYKAKSQGRNRIAYHNEQHGDLMLG
ncbi:diguanylate cyclase (GGDEF) domain-containing protein [Ferrimonas sediminum]|uniref:diguanylate cyclase n=1 Tax=Ferrimonas sediminum TaxID=718193 RepID=A0A1G8LJH0_9GAMM|nr:diguanylate cyclase [Ferrimonas sediminum]SDI55816.1 diguanylate cyclase (GGDEF) domain-containing protein [Ferrimonas sediminum]